MKNKSKKYSEAIEWIAINDEPSIYEVEDLSTLLTVTLIADLFKILPKDVAKDVIWLKRIPLDKIVIKMIEEGVDKDLVKNAQLMAAEYEGTYDLMILWFLEESQQEKQFTIDDIRKEVEDLISWKKSDEFFDRIKQVYFACDSCLQKAGGKSIPGHICTVSLGDCEVCGAKEVTLIPWVDYQWRNIGRNALAIANRD